jgi:hypothetical protein
MEWNLSGRAAIRAKFSLTDLTRVTCSKQMPNLVTFHWAGDHSEQPLTFLIPQAKLCIETVSTRFRALKATSEAVTQASEMNGAGAKQAVSAAGSGSDGAAAAFSDSFNADCDSADDLP